MFVRKHAFAAALAAAGLAFGTGVSAQVVITQASVAAGGITPGDAPGFPATLSATGSYILGSNLVTSGASAILVSGRNVSLDLNGFTIDGGNRCTPGTGTPATGNSCQSMTPLNVALIDVTGPHARIHNGSVIGSPGKGISIWGTLLTFEHMLSGQQLRDLTIAHNRDHGLHAVDEGGQVRNVKAYLNGGTGLYLSTENLVESLTASRSGQEGVVNFGYINGRQIVSTLNGGTGVFADSGTLTLAESSANAGSGFWGSTVLANSRAFGNVVNGVELSHLTYETVLRDNAQRSYVGSASGCYARLYHRTSSAVTPQIQGGTPLNGVVTTCP